MPEPINTVICPQHEPTLPKGMELSTNRISARSRRQAMDWSLVLVSQGIESTIHHAPDGEDWGLLVNETEHTAALEAIRLYRLENRGWPWRQRLLKPGLVFDWGILAWVLLVVFFYWVDAQSGLRNAGMMDSSLVVKGQWWRIFTAVWLHADLAHLATNATIGLVLGGLAMGRYGTGAGLLAAYLAGAVGNITAWLLSSGPHHSLGGSGMVMGSLGLLAAQSLVRGPSPGRPVRHVLGGVLGGIMLFTILGLSPGTDILAHLGGFCGGALLGALLSLIPKSEKLPGFNMGCGFLFVALVLLPWWLALSAARPQS